MLVRANAVGYAGKDGHALRQPGDVFEVPDGEKAKWYDEVETKKADDKKDDHKGAGNKAKWYDEVETKKADDKKDDHKGAGNKG